MSKKREQSKPQLSGAALEKRRRQVEATATFGLLLVAAALLAPFATFLGGGDSGLISAGASGWSAAYKWIYAAGALVFTFARLVNVSDPGESLRLRRLRRLEFWAGMAFCVGAFFWFYNSRKLSSMPYVGQMAVLRDTVVFSLAGAMLQIIASWMIVWRKKKEARQAQEAREEKKERKGSGK